MEILKSRKVKWFSQFADLIAKPKDKPKACTFYPFCHPTFLKEIRSLKQSHLISIGYSTKLSKSVHFLSINSVVLWIKTQPYLNGDECADAHTGTGVPHQCTHSAGVIRPTYISTVRCNTCKSKKRISALETFTQSQKGTNDNDHHPQGNHYQ